MSIPRIRRSTFCGCCEWGTFLDGYLEHMDKWFGAPPTKHQWNWAVKDWKSGNTGWEAAHNAQRRIKARVIRKLGEQNRASEIHYVDED